jgi:class 3 adenylate cyclase
VPARPPSGTVTFLFTGIQDSLRRWDEAPAEMAAGQRIHDAIVREAIEGHGGHVFAIDGDGFCAAFATAVSAAEAAVEAQRKLRTDATTGFAVRMGCTPERRWSRTAATPGARSTGRRG